MYLFLYIITFVLSLSRVVKCEDEIQVVVLPIWNTNNSYFTEIPLNFTVFGHQINLLLKRNNRLLAPSFQVWRHDGDEIEKVSELAKPSSCYYLHGDYYTSAAINLCQSREVHGIIMLENETLEIFPLESEDAWIYYKTRIDKRSNEILGEPHLVRRAQIPRTLSSLIFKRDTYITNELFPDEKKINSNKRLTIELAVFFDEVGYKTFAPFLNHDEAKMRDMLLAYVNGVQALFHHPSLGSRIDISLVRLDLMKSQPRDLPHFGGERSKLLNSFCTYNKVHNPKSDDDPNHWDISLYVSGLDFYAYENGQKNSVTMGLATVGGVCLDQYSCVIAEFGVTNRFGKPYPSAGFTSVYIAAHEIGHNLGMHHDSTGNACPKDGYIMSPSRGTQGETIWSECSRDVIRNLPSRMSCLLDHPQKKQDKSLSHEKFSNLPGRKWNAKRQCELLLRDEDATVRTLHGACEALQCKSPHRSGYYYAGPALDGTVCGVGRECRGGQCIPINSNDSQNPEITNGGWSEWKDGPCKSGCIQNSLGAYESRRSCTKPFPVNTNSGCEGPAYDVVLCKDTNLCKKIRRTVVDFATTKCRIFSEKLTHLDTEGSGLQAPHELERPWMACAIFCRRKDISSYYTPRVELNDLGLDPYFPDGTWCHREGDEDYFCRQHHCLPENFQFSKDLTVNIEEDDMQIGPQNAYPGDQNLPEQLVRYLSLGTNGRPLLTTLTPDIATQSREDDWTDRDYIELPETLRLALYSKESASASRLNFM